MCVKCFNNFVVVLSWLFFCHFDIDVCIYSTCTFFDCQADFDVDNVQRRELVIFLRGIALYKSYYYY